MVVTVCVIGLTTKAQIMSLNERGFNRKLEIFIYQTGNKLKNSFISEY
jgi:hypothetical protein